MTAKAKSMDPATNLRYFVEEQLVSSPSLLVALVVVAVVGHGPIADAVVGHGPIADDLRAGFTTFFEGPVWPLGILIGVMSQGTGIFGGLILLDPRENTFSVPVNRASSVVAGVIATVAIGCSPGPGSPIRSSWRGRDHGRGDHRAVAGRDRGPPARRDEVG